MIKIGEDLNKENVYKYVSSYDIFRKYSKNFKKIGKSFLSDFREESHPSCQISYIGGDLLYTDFGLGKSFRAVDFVMALYNLSYYEALNKINKDFNLGLGYMENRGHSSKIKPIKTELPKHLAKEKTVSIIQVKSRELRDYDIEYWGSYGITQYTLSIFNVVAISNFWINGKHYLAHKYSYSYNFYFEDGVFRRKIYQPFSKLKWISNGGKVVQGEVNLPKKGDLLIITKSMKDVMCLFELGYVAVAPPAESMFLPEDYYKKQKERFNNIVMLYDNDETGVTFAKKYSSEHNINKYIFIPKEYNSKDISDFVKNHGKEQAINLLNHLI